MGVNLASDLTGLLSFREGELARDARQLLFGLRVARGACSSGQPRVRHGIREALPLEQLPKVSQGGTIELPGAVKVPIGVLQEVLAERERWLAGVSEDRSFGKVLHVCHDERPQVLGHLFARLKGMSLRTLARPPSPDGRVHIDRYPKHEIELGGCRVTPAALLGQLLNEIERILCVKGALRRKLHVVDAVQDGVVPEARAGVEAFRRDPRCEQAFVLVIWLEAERQRSRDRHAQLQEAHWRVAILLPQYQGGPASRLCGRRFVVLGGLLRLLALARSPPSGRSIAGSVPGRSAAGGRPSRVGLDEVVVVVQLRGFEVLVEGTIRSSV
mmetsp:Transcript_4152/g.16110  ORF Transcript_4152/g.16110 Transcript_4152/m.16110 type:complete len:328 (+) Transcript_4152:5068-6051(+)